MTKGKTQNTERTISGENIRKIFYPADYSDLDKVRNYLFYKYGIDLEKYNKVDNASEGLELLKELYQKSSYIIFQVYGEQLSDNYQHGDILYLLLKEYLYLYCNSLKTKRDNSNPYSEEYLAKKFSDKIDYAKTIRKYYNELHKNDYFHMFEHEDFYALLENEPYNVIAYNIIALSHENPLLLHHNTNAPDTKPLSLNEYEQIRIKESINNSFLDNFFICNKENIENVFTKTLIYVSIFYDNKLIDDKIYKWDTYENSEKQIALKLLYFHFSEFFDDFIHNSFFPQEDQLSWERLSSEQQFFCKEKLEKLFIKHLNQEQVRKRRKKGIIFNARQWSNYAESSTNAFYRIFPDYTKSSNTYICNYLTSIWIQGDCEKKSVK